MLAMLLLAGAGFAADAWVTKSAPSWFMAGALGGYVVSRILFAGIIW